jgi:hypothetical protein
MTTALKAKNLTRLPTERVMKKPSQTKTIRQKQPELSNAPVNHPSIFFRIVASKRKRASMKLAMQCTIENSITT